MNTLFYIYKHFIIIVIIYYLIYINIFLATKNMQRINFRNLDKPFDEIELLNLYYNNAFKNYRMII